MEPSSEFVQERMEERKEDQSRAPGGATGWESIVFELEDDYGSDFSTAAMAP